MESLQEYGQGLPNGDLADDVTWPYDVIPVTLLYANFGAPYLQF